MVEGGANASNALVMGEEKVVWSKMEVPNENIAESLEIPQSGKS